MSRVFVVTMTILLALTASRCGSSPTPTMATPTLNPTLTPTTPNSVSSITGLSPALGTVLAPGQVVTITGTAGYTLTSAETGTVFMVIQDQANRNLQQA